MTKKKNPWPKTRVWVHEDNTEKVSPARVEEFLKELTFGAYPVVEATNEAIDEYINKLLKDAGIENPTDADREFVKNHEKQHARMHRDLVWNEACDLIIKKTIEGETK